MDQSTFDTHGAWDALRLAEEALKSAQGREEAKDAAPLERINFALSWARSHADAPDPAQYSSVGLTGLQSPLAQVRNELTNFASNGVLQHLANAESYCDSLTYQLGLLPVSWPKGGAAAQANRIFTEYREAAQVSIDELKKANEQLRLELASTHSDHESAVTSLRAEIEKMSTKVTADEARLDAALTKSNDAFIQSQTERDDAFKEFLKEQAKELKSVASTDLEEIKRLRKEADAAYQAVDKLRVGTEKVSGLASADILAGKFEGYSKHQFWWGVGANALGFVALTAGLIVIGTSLAHLGVDQKVSWQWTTLKLGVTLTIVAASAVAFRLGAIFLSRSSTSKRMELELRAIGPFFADITDPEVVTSAKQAFVERSFGRSWDAKASAAPDVPTDSTSQVLKEIVEIVKTVASKAQ